MPETEKQINSIDWSLTTFEGARREQLRRWSKLTLREILLAQEERHEIAERLSRSDPSPI